MSRCMSHLRAIEYTKLSWEIPENFEIGMDPVMFNTAYL